MNQDRENPDQPSPAADASDPQFMRRFQEAIGSWSAATLAGKPEEANAAAMQALAK